MNNEKPTIFTSKRSFLSEKNGFHVVELEPSIYTTDHYELALCVIEEMSVSELKNIHENERKFFYRFLIDLIYNQGSVPQSSDEGITITLMPHPWRSYHELDMEISIDSDNVVLLKVADINSPFNEETGEYYDSIAMKVESNTISMIMMFSEEAMNSLDNPTDRIKQFINFSK